jgi:hypothetical protein
MDENKTLTAKTSQLGVEDKELWRNKISFGWKILTALQKVLNKKIHVQTNIM